MDSKQIFIGLHCVAIIFKASVILGNSLLLAHFSDKLVWGSKQLVLVY